MLCIEYLNFYACTMSIVHCANNWMRQKGLSGCAMKLTFTANHKFQYTGRFEDFNTKFAIHRLIHPSQQTTWRLVPVCNCLCLIFFLCIYLGFTKPLKTSNWKALFSHWPPLKCRATRSGAIKRFGFQLLAARLSGLHVAILMLCTLSCKMLVLIMFVHFSVLHWSAGNFLVASQENIQFWLNVIFPQLCAFLQYAIVLTLAMSHICMLVYICHTWIQD